MTVSSVNFITYLQRDCFLGKSIDTFLNNYLFWSSSHSHLIKSKALQVVFSPPEEFQADPSAWLLRQKKYTPFPTTNKINMFVLITPLHILLRLEISKDTPLFSNNTTHRHKSYEMHTQTKLHLIAIVPPDGLQHGCQDHRLHLVAVSNRTTFRCMYL